MEKEYDIEQKDSNDLLGLYFSELSSDYLTLEEDIELGKIKDLGLAAREEYEKSNGNLSSEEEEELEIVIRRGKEAENIFAERNGRLVIKIAKRYAKSEELTKDLIQEGNLGLIKAIEKYDPQLGVKFSSHAFWWVRLYIQRALPEYRPVRLPVHMFQSIIQYNGISERFLQTNNRKPSIQEIAEEMGESIEKVQKIEKALKVDTFYIEESTHSDTNLDSDYPYALKQDGGNGRILDYIEDKERKRDLLKGISHLPKRSGEILIKYYGLDGQIPMNFRQIGLEYNLCFQRIVQLHEKAINELRIVIEEDPNLSSLKDL